MSVSENSTVVRSSRPTHRCDECGKGPRTIKRVRHGHRYCTSCYRRVFRRARCPGCDEMARLPRDTPHALCIRCERRAPCHRCGKVDYKIGRHTPYGPVCSPCARHYDEPTPCEWCGRLSNLLSSVIREGTSVRLCHSCATEKNKTCASCTRHRPVWKTIDGKPHCRLCVEEGTSICNTCSTEMPAGYGKRCRECDTRARLARRIAMNRAAFVRSDMADRFEAFGIWLSAEIGVEKAALKINRYLPFFMDVERRWGAIPNYEALLEYFGTAGLRKVLLVSRWLAESGIVAVDETVKKESALRHRIDSLLSRLPEDTKARALIDTYHEALGVRHASGRLSLGSLKCALVPAVALLERSLNEGDEILPSQQALEDYLSESPGQRAAIHGFIAHLRGHHGTVLDLPHASSPKATERRRATLEAEIARLLDQEERNTAFEERWLALGLSYFHDLSRSLARKLARSTELQRTDDGFEVSYKDATYYVPAPPQPIPGTLQTMEHDR